MNPNNMNNLSSTCRACLTNSETFSYVLDETSQEMYWFCTSIEIKQDELPKWLCEKCFSLLTEYSDFKKTCIQSENILQGILHGLSKSIKSESVDERYVELKPKLERHASQELEDNVRIKEVEDNVKVKEVEENVMIKEVEENVWIKSEECNDADTLEADLDDDIKADDDSYLRVRRVKKSLEIKKSFKKTIHKPHQLKKRYNFACKLCNKKFGFRERFDAHMLEHEGKSTSIYCLPCNKTFTTWGGLKRHIDCEHTNLSVDQLTCNLCSKVFKSPRTLKVHYATHGERKLKMCDVCGNGFKSDVTLKAHLETHVKNRERRYTCQHCGKKYLSKKTCATHTSRRHSDKRYICHHCNYPFTDKSNLAKHILIHEGKQPLHKCDLCPKTYSSQSALVIHKRIHTGERPYLCNYCPKRFANRRMLVDHQRIHTGEKPHKCLVCEQSFTQRGTMTRHMKVHDRL